MGSSRDLQQPRESLGKHRFQLGPEKMSRCRQAAASGRLPRLEPGRQAAWGRLGTPAVLGLHACSSCHRLGVCLPLTDTEHPFPSPDSFTPCLSASVGAPTEPWAPEFLRSSYSSVDRLGKRAGWPPASKLLTPGHP